MICKDTSPHQLHCIFWSEVFNHCTEMCVAHVWCAAALLDRRSRGARHLLMKAPALAIFQQEDCPFNEGKALSTELQRGGYCCSHQVTGYCLS